MMNEKALCTARELAIGYGKTPLLSDICLGAQPGQILTLIGPNGAGKSTLLKTLAGQLAPMGGTVLLAGKDLTAYTGTQRAQKLALMAPHSRRMELTTCFDFVSAGRYPYTGRLPGCCLGGAAFCLFCDLLARSLFAPTELSISSVTAVFGAPVVIWLLVRRNSEREGA